MRFSNQTTSVALQAFGDNSLVKLSMLKQPVAQQLFSLLRKKFNHKTVSRSRE